MDILSLFMYRHYPDLQQHLRRIQLIWVRGLTAFLSNSQSPNDCAPRNPLHPTLPNAMRPPTPAAEPSVVGDISILVPKSFGTQYSSSDFGRCRFGRLCPCQKHPLI